MKFAEFVVHEFSAHERVLEDLELKAAPNSNDWFAKIDMLADIAETPSFAV